MLHHYQLVMLAQMVVGMRHERRVEIEVRLVALAGRLGLTRQQTWNQIQRLASGKKL